MTGLPEFNYPAFNAMAETLRGQGHDVVNPADERDTTQTYEYYMRRAIENLLTCEGVVMLPGWEKSRGARMEHVIASNLGMTIRYAVPE